MIIVVLVVLLVLLSFSKIGTTGKAIDLKCSDSDGGDNRFEKGTISGIHSTGTSFSLTDYCTSEGRLKEYRCNIGQGDPGWENIYYICENECADGACI